MVNKSMKKLFVGLAVLSSATAFASSSSSDSNSLSTSKGFFQPRAASANIAREMMMQPNDLHMNSEGWYGGFSATAFYQRNWNQSPVTSTTDASSSSDSNGLSSLGALPFWSGTNVMVTGSNAGGAVVAATPLVDVYQFGLGNATVDTTGTVQLNPIVYQAGSDFMFIVGSSANEPGFYAKIKAPIAVYSINPQLTEVNTALTLTNYGQGAIDQVAGTIAGTATSMVQAFAGTGTAQGDLLLMTKGLINGTQSTGAKFGDIEMTAGYSFVSNEDNSITVALRASAPTGNKATGEYMLEPIVGRGGNWGLGGYAAGHVCLWEGNNDNRFTLKFMSDVMHLFTTSTKRSYDLTNNGEGSRYLLVADYGSTGLVYAGSIQNLINVSTLTSDSSFGVEGDVAAAFNYDSHGWTVDLGYEFYGRSAEKLAITQDFVSGQYAVLGHQGVANTTDGTIATAFNQPLATMTQSVVQGNATSGVAGAQNQVVAVAAATNIQLADFNQEAAQQSAYLTSKVFSKVAYKWESSDYVPFLGVMGEFEFSNSSNNALPQWGVVLVGGVSF